MYVEVKTKLEQNVANDYFDINKNLFSTILNNNSERDKMQTADREKNAECRLWSF